ncbi:MAG: prepilin-type N-terminal cleavage/methylation domain-containing protein [Desulfobacteraceae bacterium]|nr:prepilin-type N-terminal cleavage/methylation domain-containing protein [Desulfobacteraceae bacterium]
MKGKFKNRFKTIGNDKGFTLVEMAIVLVIIGIIIGAVAKGGDLVRSAEQKRIYTKFLSEWRLGYLAFYDRTGRILGDTYDDVDGGTGQDGQADTAKGAEGAPTDDGRTALGTSGVTDFLGLSDVGLDTPSTNTSKAWQYKYVNSSGEANLLNIAFEWSGTYNYMMIDNIPNELGMAIDTMIDGEADGTSGNFLGPGGTAWGTVPSDTNTDARWLMKF